MEGKWDFEEAQRQKEVLRLAGCKQKLKRDLAQLARDSEAKRYLAATRVNQSRLPNRVCYLNIFRMILT